MGLLVTPDAKGDRLYSPKNGSDFTLEELRNIIGTGDDGLVEIVQGRSGTLYICDEEGKLKGLRQNVAVTAVGRQDGAISLDDYFVGRVLVCQSNEVR